MTAILGNSRFQNNTGSSVLEVNLLIQLPFVFNCSAILISSLFFRKSNAFKTLIFEFITIILPLILFLTVLSDHVYVIYVVFTMIILCLLVISIIILDLKVEWKNLAKYAVVTDHKLPCISHLRGVLNVYSVICILAADFTCFPKRFLKTDTFGFGLMDTGVGLYVAAFAFTNSHRSNSFTLWFSLRKMFPLFLLGIGRYVSVFLLQYQHIVSEYGVHWNFFITLSVLGLVNDLIFKLVVTNKSIRILSVVILILYEISLNAGLRDWIFSDAARKTFISANREGIFSLIGYEVIYLFCVQIKNTLPKKGDSILNYVHFVKKYLRIWFLLSLLTLLSHFTVGVSRRCANCGYVFWITSLVLFNLVTIISFELFTLVLSKKFKLNINSMVPLIAVSVNFNSLTFFLLANVITGLINLTFNTLLLNEAKSLLIIIIYMLFCCTVNVILYANKWRIR